MNIAVIGSTGRTGRLVIEEGVRQGHGVTAFTRRPKELTGVHGLKAIVAGDGRNVADLRNAIRGQDAVISIVSPNGRGPTKVVSDVAKATLTAMTESRVRRLVSVSVSALQGQRPWVAIQLMRWFFRRPFEDFARMEGLVAASPLDWTIVRPPYLSNGRRTGRIRIVVGRHDFPGGPYSISRSDLAALLLDLATDSQHTGKVILVSKRH